MTEINRELIKKELERANSSLKAAQELLRKELFADVVSRAYYACLHSAKAALLTQGTTVSSHRAAVTLFGQHLVQTGKIEKEYGIILREEKEEREIGDYDVFEIIEVDRAQQRVTDAQRFVKRVEEFINQAIN